MTQDDIAPGMWIVTMGLRGMKDDAGNPIQFPLDGRPLHIKSVSLPFVLIEGKSGEFGILDLRRHEFGRVADDYVYAVRSLMDKLPPQLSNKPAPACPECGGSLAVMMKRSSDGGAASTSPFCPRCHWEGGNG